MKKAYLAIKFHEDHSNRELIEGISDALKSNGVETTIFVRDFENWGEKKYKLDELMRLAFKAIEESDVLIVEFSEKGVGLGIEAGYAHAKGIPIIVIAKSESDVSDTLKGIAKEVLFYSDVSELGELIKKI